MNRTRQPGPDAAHRALLWLLVTATAVLAARSQQWTSAVTTAAAVYAVAGPDRRSRP
ncbi:hypothetical protein [Streptomyces ardesiacus]|uniref:hypothetical protein n=1 Tax=Streptomyces ardesiacus TaxID=285564 RepID=UPI003679CB75